MVSEPDDIPVAIKMWVKSLRRVATVAATYQAQRKAEPIARAECFRNQA